MSSFRFSPRNQNKISTFYGSSTPNFFSKTDIDVNVPIVRSRIAAGDSRISVPFETDSKAEEIRILKGKILDWEIRYNSLYYENEQTIIDLAHEKNKVSQVERQLQFVKENQAVFEKLREAYINMKQKQENPAPDKIVEVRDKGIQTWDGIICRACLDTEKLRSELAQFKSAYDGCVVIKQDEMEKINATLQALKCFAQAPSKQKETPPEKPSEDVSCEVVDREDAELFEATKEFDDDLLKMRQRLLEIEEYKSRSIPPSMGRFY